MSSSAAALRPVVLLAEKLAPSAVALLGDDVEIRHVDGTDRPALLAALADADALLVRSATTSKSATTARMARRSRLSSGEKVIPLPFER